MRTISKDQRTFLNAISRRFEQVVNAALEGHWTKDTFFDLQTRRLRAQVRNINDDFEREMKLCGHTHQICQPPVAFIPLSTDMASAFHPKAITRQEMISKIDKILKSGRGRELPGMFDPILVSDIFRQESKKWELIALRYVDKIWCTTQKFLEDLLSHIAPAKSNAARMILQGVIDGKMQTRRQAVQEKTEELMTPYKREIPFTTASRMAVSLRHVEAEELQSQVDNKKATFSESEKSSATTVDIDACSMLLRWFKAYYSVALETFIDNMATLAAENCDLTLWRTWVTKSSSSSQGNLKSF